MNCGLTTSRNWKKKTMHNDIAFTVSEKCLLVLQNCKKANSAHTVCRIGPTMPDDMFFPVILRREAPKNPLRSAAAFVWRCFASLSMTTRAQTKPVPIARFSKLNQRGKP